MICAPCSVCDFKTEITICCLDIGNHNACFDVIVATVFIYYDGRCGKGDGILILTAIRTIAGVIRIVRKELLFSATCASRLAFANNGSKIVTKGVDWVCRRAMICITAIIANISRIPFFGAST